MRMYSRNLGDVINISTKKYLNNSHFYIYDLWPFFIQTQADCSFYKTYDALIFTFKWPWTTNAKQNFYIDENLAADCWLVCLFSSLYHCFL